MAYSVLDEAKKDRISTRISSLIHTNAVVYDSLQIHKEITALLDRAKGLDDATKSQYLRDTVAPLLQKQVIMLKEQSRLFCQSGRLYLFAPLPDITFFERAVHLSAMMVMNVAVAPTGWLFLRIYHRSDS